eukprot:TRINITY_DN532_c0_g1_i1.p1 TRINITY_DN532_c0_g1~~TRINITY_DN532_c0_g1_i1.p1  ORF type:complete len:201 (+),score=73.72 TRINITY_DN532_c0_g1_i1:2-604(+)
MATPEVKVVLLGASGVGKSSLVSRYTQGSFSDTIEQTVGGSYFPKKITVDGQTIKLQIWDTAGQERFSALLPMYYHGAKGAILVYDISSPESFERVKAYEQELKNNITDYEVALAIVGSKLDLVTEPVEITKVAEEFAKEKKAVCIKTSAKTNIGVEEVFLQIARKILHSGSDNVEENKGFKINTEENYEEKPNKKKCCK